MLCPGCGSPQAKLYIRINNWSINSCKTCGLLYTVNKNSALNKNFYNLDYVEGYKFRESKLKARFAKHLDRIKKYKAGGKLLDVGCGMGYFLTIAQQSLKPEWKIAGVEPNTDLIELSSAKVKKYIREGNLSKIPFNNDSFDCVTCFDVLEHDYKLSENLDEIIRVLKKDGILVVQAPNYKSLMGLVTRERWDWWAPPDHLLHLSFNYLLKTLRRKEFLLIEKFTYENEKDFLSNIKGTIKNNYLLKTFFYLSIPLLLIIERLSWVVNMGALSFIIARKN